MSIDSDEALKVVNDYISQVDALLKKSYKKGTDKKRELDTAVQNFIRVALPNGERKLKDYKSSVHFYFGVLGYVPTEEERQEDYISRLKKMQHFLIAYKQELQLRRASKKKASKLDEIERETQVREAEARRRATVVEGKLWGAVIELIDIQRDELKKRGELNQEIIELHRELRTLKSMFIQLSKSLERLISRTN